MRLLRPALERDFAFCEALNRSNMARYLEARNIGWDSERYLASWRQFENYIICADGVSVGTLRVLQLDRVLEIRDLQLLPAHTGRGIGTWPSEKRKRWPPGGTLVRCSCGCTGKIRRSVCITGSGSVLLQRLTASSTWHAM